MISEKGKVRGWETGSLNLINTKISRLQICLQPKEGSRWCMPLCVLSLLWPSDKQITRAKHKAAGKYRQWWRSLMVHIFGHHGSTL